MSQQTSDPLVSIIMPTYNRAAYIAETIHSIQQQTYANWELLIMDDGSDDRTKEIVLQLKQEDNRIQYYNDSRKGITGTLKNKGIQLAKGAVVAFMDSDDLWPEDKLSIQVRTMQEYPEAGYSFTNGYNFSDSDGTIKDMFYMPEQGSVCADFFKSMCKGETLVFIQTIMVWRTCISDAFAFRENRTFTDFSFITNLASKYIGIVIYIPLLKRRLHGGNNTTFNWVADYDEHIETIQRYKHDGRLSHAFANRVMFVVSISKGIGYMKYGQPQLARKAFIQSWQYNKMSIIPFKKIIRSYVKRRNW